MSSTLPADTCPLCRVRALSWRDTLCKCLNCGSVFEVDRATRRCRYITVAPAYAALRIALTLDWLTRRDVFGITERLQPKAPALSAVPVDSRTPFKVLVLMLLGILALIPVLCACLAVLVLAPGMTQTRQLIAAVNTLSVELTPTVNLAMTVSITQVQQLSQTVAAAVGASPALTTTVQATTDPNRQPTSPVSQTLKPTLTVTVNGRASPTPPSASPTPLVLNRQPTATPFIVRNTPGSPLISPLSSPTGPPLPATFTPVPTGPIVVNTSTATPLPQGTLTVTAAPTQGILGTATVTPLPGPTATPNGKPIVTISSTVVISTVMYAGTPAQNMADQYVEVQNRGQSPISIGNWFVHAVSSNLKSYYTNGLVLLPGQTCRIYGSSPPANTSGCGAFSFNSSSAVWSTSSDVAELYTDQGELVGTYAYSVPH